MYVKPKITLTYVNRSVNERSIDQSIEWVTILIDYAHYIELLKQNCV